MRPAGAAIEPVIIGAFWEDERTSFLKIIYLPVYLLLAVQGLPCCAWAFSSCREWGYFLLQTMGSRIWALILAQRIKHLPAMQETQVRSLGWEDPLEKEMATHSNILAWRIPCTVEPGGYSPWGCKKSDTTEWTSLSFYQRLNSWGAWLRCPLACGYLPGPGIDPMSSAGASGLLTTGPPGKSQEDF